MKLSRLAGPVLGIALVAAGLAPRADAQTRVTAGVRGKVVDEQGKGIEGVTLDMEYKGESRLKIAKTQVTDKKGGFVRMGVPGGPWRIVFSKAGYETFQHDVTLSDGGFTELSDIVMKAGKAAVTAAPVAKDEVVPVLPPESSTMKDVYNKAVDASRAGNLEDAERLYKEVLEKLPNLAEVHYNLGHVYVRKNDLASAEAEFRKAVELQPQRPEFYIALAALYGSDGKTQEAADLLIQAKGSFEEDAKFQFALGTAALNVGRNDEAAPAFRKAVKLDPANAEAHYYLASVAVGENKVGEAIAELEKYLSMSGQDPQNVATAKALLAALKAKK